MTTEFEVHINQLLNNNIPRGEKKNKLEMGKNQNNN